MGWYRVIKYRREHTGPACAPGLGEGQPGTNQTEGSERFRGEECQIYIAPALRPPLGRPGPVAGVVWPILE
jgi:hypothetical protein